MAEIVQRHMESMSDEIEEMRRTRLYTLEETRFILRSRKEFEYKINGVVKNPQDFKDYIQYEMILLKQVRSRRDKHTIAERKSGIEYKILRKIKNLYEIALQRFPDNFSMYLSYFNFCKQSSNLDATTNIIQKMLQHFASEVEVWQVAYAWYANERKDVNGALKILNKALTIHKNRQTLYTEALKLELSVVKEGDDETVHAKVCKKIETYIKLIFSCINDADYLIEVLELLETYPFTGVVQNLIIEKLLEKYSEKEFLWHTLAQRERRGLHYSFDDDNSEKSCLTRCFDTYKMGLTKVCFEEKQDLWSKYLDCLNDIQEENIEVDDVKKKFLLKSALEQAFHEGCLSENHYARLLTLGTDDEALQVLEKGTAALPESLDLWIVRLNYAIMTDKMAQVGTIFNEGKTILKSKSLPLWLMCLRYYGLLSKDEKILALYEEGVREAEEISQELKPKFIRWLALAKGIVEARKKYLELAVVPPYCKQLHLAMSEMEAAEMESNYPAWMQVHELACQQFGHEDVDVWVNRILFHLRFDNMITVTAKVQYLQNEAEKMLKHELLKSEFQEKFKNAVADL